MNMSFGEALKICDELIEKFSPTTHPEYINGVGVAQLGSYDENCSESKKDNYCLLIMLVKPFPPNIIIPNTFNNLKIFTKVVGVTRLGF